jgi:5-methylcytosine-specific restriction endonuclease McrA
MFLARCQTVGELYWRNRVRYDACCYCGTTDELRSIEHVIPVSLGGIVGHANYVAACHTCNRERGNTPLLLFLIERGRLDWTSPSKSIKAQVA